MKIVMILINKSHQENKRKEKLIRDVMIKKHTLTMMKRSKLRIITFRAMKKT
jgi:hypothetical protein